MDEIEFPFEKLAGFSNYRIWSIQARSTLEIKDLWQFVVGTPVEPTKYPDESNRSFDERSASYRTDKAKARAIILRAVSDPLVLVLERTKSAQEAWNTLQQRYQPSGMAHRCSAWLDWVSFDWNGEDLDKFCSEYMQRLHAMDTLEVEVKEEFRIYMFLQRIDPYFETFAARLRERMRDTSDEEAKKGNFPLTLEEIISRLLDEQRIKSLSKTGLPSRKSQQKKSSTSKCKRRC